MNVSEKDPSPHGMRKFIKGSSILPTRHTELSGHERITHFDMHVEMSYPLVSAQLCMTSGQDRRPFNKFPHAVWTWIFFRNVHVGSPCLVSVSEKWDDGPLHQ